MENPQTPDIGDRVVMEGVDAVIKIARVPDEQAEGDAGLFDIVDQYGDIHRVEAGNRDGEWVVVVPGI